MKTENKQKYTQLHIFDYKLFLSYSIKIKNASRNMYRKIHTFTYGIVLTIITAPDITCCSKPFRLPSLYVFPLKP